MRIATFISFLSLPYPRRVLGVVCGVTLLLIPFLGKLSFDTGFSSLMPANETELFTTVREGSIHLEPGQAVAPASLSPDPKSDIETETTRRNSFPLSFFFVFESDNLFDSQVLSTLSTVMNRLEERTEFGGRISPFRHQTIQVQESGLPRLVSASPKTDSSSWTEHEAQEFRKRITADDLARNYLISADHRSFLIYYQVGSRAQEFIKEYERIIEPLREFGQVYISGSAPLTARVQDYLNKDLVIFISLSFIAMGLIYTIAFRSKRGVLLPFALSGLSLVWTLGFMGLAGFPLGMISVIVPPIIITLSSSYSIHFLHEYYRGLRSGESDPVDYALGKVYRTILFASSTTIIGFMSLLISSSTAFRQFGLIVSLGVGVCTVLSLTFLPASMTLLHRIKKSIRQPGIHQIMSIPIQDTTSTKYHESAQGWTIIQPIVSIGVTLVLIVGFLISFPNILIQSDFMSYFPDHEPLYQDALEIARIFGGLEPFRVTITAPVVSEPLTTDSTKNPGSESPPLFPDLTFLQAVSQFEQVVLNQSRDIAHSLSYTAYMRFVTRTLTGSQELPGSEAQLRLAQMYIARFGQNALSSVLRQIIDTDHQSLTLVMRYFDGETTSFQNPASAERVLQVLEENLHYLPANTRVRIWGSGVQTLTLYNTILENQRSFTLLATLLVLAAAIGFFRSVSLGFMAIVPVVLGIMANYLLMYLFAIPVNVVTLGFASITVGVGVDDAMHLLLRFRYMCQMKPELTQAQALNCALNETTRPIVLTSLAMVSGLLILCFASYSPIRYFGILVSFSLLSTLFATVVILPGYILLLNKPCSDFHE